jgi:DNA-binding transcriptional LysR family regulator
MERQDIEVFLALAQELHFARTAQRLNLARPLSARRSRNWSAGSGRPCSPALPAAWT